METVSLKINGLTVEAPKGSTILEAARIAHIDIPTLCYLKEINEIGACRICVVEVKGARSLVASCVYPVAENMEVYTNTERVLESRKKTLQLLLSNHNKSCLSCVRSQDCELQRLCKELNVEDQDFYSGEQTPAQLDTSAVHMYRDNSKCILCRRCAAVCEKVQSVGVIGANERGFNTNITCAFEMDLADTSCVSCGQCIVACPTGALAEKDDTPKVFKALADPDKIVLVQTAPAVRAALGEEFGYPIGTDVDGKMVAALRRLGFDHVFDTNFSADLTIMEESHEFLDRLTNNGPLPLITSCSPGWIKYCEHYYPELIDNLSSCKSPQQMFGAIAKTYYADKIGVAPEKIVMVSVMPCTAKKFEIGRDNQDAAGIPDVDIAITTRELARMIKRVGLNFTTLPSESFDDPLGMSSGAGVIFGATGGVMEAALRTAVWKLTGQEDNTPIDFTAVRGTDGIKESSLTIGDTTISIAVVSGLGNAKELLRKVKSGEKHYHFIEIMGCPGGCVNGGGQPHVPASVRNFTDVAALRAKVLYNQDATNSIRRSHENPYIQTLYQEFLGEPGSHKAHEILHTTYVKRTVN